MKTVLLALARAACGYQPPASAVPPLRRVAFCGSTCWNSSYCIGQGFACEKCVAGTCSGEANVASAAPTSTPQ